MGSAHRTSAFGIGLGNVSGRLLSAFPEAFRLDYEDGIGVTVSFGE